MQIGLGGYLWRFGFYIIVVQLALFGFLSALEYLAPSWAAALHESGGGTGLNIAGIMLPGMYLGQKWVRTEGRPMPRGFAWKISALGTLLALAIAALALAVLIRTDPPTAELWQELVSTPGLIWIVALLTALGILLLTRLAIWSAVRGELKRQARLANRA